MIFLLLLIGFLLSFLDLFVFPELFHFVIATDLTIIWILFSWDILEEESVFVFLVCLFIKTLFIPHSLIIPYILSLSVLYVLYYFILPLFFQKETWLSFLLCLIFFIGHLIWIYHVNWTGLLLSCAVECLLFILLLFARKGFQRYRKIIKNRFVTAV